jgi:hypothetical protein
VAPWQKHDPESRPWVAVDSNSAFRRVSDALAMLRVDAGVSLDIEARSLLLVDAGEATLPGLGTLSNGDLAWLPSARRLRSAAGMSCYRLAIPDGIGPAEPVLIDSSRFPWQDFEDPHGRPTQPVQVLLDGTLSILRTRFAPAFSAAEHWHDFDTWYFITDGRMRFGHEGWYESGQVRQVTGGYSYGPEEPGAQGVEFVLVSVGGPVQLHWADLETPPNGPLAPTPAM